MHHDEIHEGKAHLYMMNKVDEIQPYLSTRERFMKEKLRQMNESWLLREHSKSGYIKKPKPNLVHLVIEFGSSSKFMVIS